jgi:hypothetical protein
VSADIGQEFIQTGSRLLRIAQRLCALPRYVDPPRAVADLTADPAEQLETLLRSILMTAEPPAPRATMSDPTPQAMPKVLEPGVAARSSAPTRPETASRHLTPDRLVALPGTRPSDLAGQHAVERRGAATLRRPTEPASILSSPVTAAVKEGRWSARTLSLPREQDDAPRHETSPDSPLVATYRAMAALNLPVASGGAIDLPPSPTSGASRPTELLPGADRQRFAPSEHGNRSARVARALELDDHGEPEMAASEFTAASRVEPADARGRFPLDIPPPQQQQVFRTAQERLTGNMQSGRAAPSGESGTGLNSGLRMARGADGLAALLRSELAAGVPQPPPSRPVPEPSTPRDVATTEPERERPGGSSDHTGELDVRDLLEQLADRLEFELVRTYGTSGG